MNITYIITVIIHSTGGWAIKSQTIFMYISCFIFVLTAYKIPKKMKPYEIYVTSLFAVLFGLIVDLVLAVKYKLYVLDDPGIQINPLIGQVVLYWTASIITLNLYPFDQSKTKKFIYVSILTLLTVAFELLSSLFGFIKYNEWKIWYSVLCYPFLIMFLVLHFKLFQRLVNRSLKQP